MPRRRTRSAAASAASTGSTPGGPAVARPSVTTTSSGRWVRRRAGGGGHLGGGVDAGGQRRAAAGRQVGQRARATSTAPVGRSTTSAPSPRKQTTATAVPSLVGVEQQAQHRPLGRLHALLGAHRPGGVDGQHDEVARLLLAHRPAEVGLGARSPVAVRRSPVARAVAASATGSPGWCGRVTTSRPRVAGGRRPPPAGRLVGGGGRAGGARRAGASGVAPGASAASCVAGLSERLAKASSSASSMLLGHAGLVERAAPLAMGEGEGGNGAHVVVVGLGPARQPGAGGGGPGDDEVGAQAVDRHRRAQAR